VNAPREERRGVHATNIWLAGSLVLLAAIIVRRRGSRRAGDGLNIAGLALAGPRR